MPKGYVTLDNVDFNEIWYGAPGGAGIMDAVDTYRQVDMPVLNNLAISWGPQIFKYGLSDYNGFQPLGIGQRPDRKFVLEASFLPTYRKFGYGVGTDLDTMRLSSGRALRMALNRPFLEDSEFVFSAMLRVMLGAISGAGPTVALNAGYGFWNGTYSPEEGITIPPRFQQNVFTANHNHYYTTGGASLDLDDITTAKLHIREHGHKGPLAGFVNSAQAKAIEDLAAWTANIVRSPISDEVAVRGFTDSFMLLGINWYVTEMMPAGYFLVVETSSDEIMRPIVHFEPPNMKGLLLMAGPITDYPLVESFFERWMGFKIFQRGAGVVVQISANATYTAPTILG